MDHAFAGPYGTAGGDAVFCGLGTGTFAEETVVPAAAAIRIDPAFPLELAALVGCAVVTGVGAVVNTAHVAPGESVAVVGCGGVGLAAVQGARLAGAATAGASTTPSRSSGRPRPSSRRTPWPAAGAR